MEDFVSLINDIAEYAQNNQNTITETNIEKINQLLEFSELIINNNDQNINIYELHQFLFETNLNFCFH